VVNSAICLIASVAIGNPERHMRKASPPERLQH